MPLRNSWGRLLATVAAAALLGSMPAAVSAQDETDDNNARTLFQSGTIQYERGEFREAAASYTAAYELSGRPVLLFNMYLAYRDAGQPAEAAAALRRYLQEMPAEEIADQRAMLEGRAANLEAQAARENSEPEASDPVAEPPPEQASPPPERGAPIGPIVLVAAGGAAVIAGVATAFVTSGIESDLEEACPDRRCAPEEQSEIDRGKRMAAVTDVLLIAGGAIAIGGALWWILGRPSDDDLQADAACMSDGCSMQLRGSF